MNNLRVLRTERRLTLRELSEKVNLSYSSIAMLEREERQFTTETIKIFTSFFGCTSDYLLGKTNDNSKCNDVKIAFYNQHGIVDDEQKKEIENFIEFVKARDKNDK